MPLRLFIDQPLARHAPLSLRPQHSHYLTRLMRCKSRGVIHIFNGKQDLWQAILSDSFYIIHEQKILPQPHKTRTVALAFSPIKQQNCLVEKATERSVSDFYPILCHRTVVRPFLEKRHKAIIYEACEQSYRLHIPDLHPTQTLDRFIRTQSDSERVWTLLSPLSEHPLKPHTGTISLCIGPKGGWSPQEQQMCQKYSQMRWDHIGPVILRAKTAAVASLAIAQSTL